jgi:hypothetical protein
MVVNRFKGGFNQLHKLLKQLLFGSSDDLAIVQFNRP